MSRSSSSPVDPHSLDVGHLALFVGQAFNAVVQRRLHEAGFAGLRVSHGYVVQHLLVAPRSVGELAGLLGVSQQMVSKTVGELERLGYLERGASESDRRVRRVSLSARGRAAVARSRREREVLAKKLEAKLGKRQVDRARKTLAVALDHLGGADAVRARGVRMPR